jgi:hypothetical protein
MSNVKFEGVENIILKLKAEYTLQNLAEEDSFIHHLK